MTFARTAAPPAVDDCLTRHRSRRPDVSTHSRRLDDQSTRPRELTVRLWTLHPKYLDRQGLTALWREGLLAQAVLRGRTRGYRAHPQLDRFRASRRPIGLIAAYLHAVWLEACRRGYHYDRRRISGRPAPGRVPVPRGQLAWEWDHLRQKLRGRSPRDLERWKRVRTPQPHPVFRIVPGGPAPWERGYAGTP